jgi:hypothetical protein
MSFSDFVEMNRAWWTKYFKDVSMQVGSTIVDDDGNYRKILYPNMLIYTNFGDYYVVELVGAVTNFSGFLIKEHKESSIDSYFSQFSDTNGSEKPLFKLDGGNIVFRGMYLSQTLEKGDQEYIKNRFPYRRLFPFGAELIGGGKGSLLELGEKFSSALLHNTILINKYNSIIRCKHLSTLFVIKNTCSFEEAFGMLYKIREEEDIRGVNFVLPGEEELIIIGQFKSIFLFPGLRETTLGSFINRHPQLIKKAFGTEHFVYEQSLKWIERSGTRTDTAIKPDLMIKRQDGFYDIYDLKLALLTKRDITKGKPSRRRFIDSVYEGIAQLLNYELYFTYAANAKLAKEKYGISVNCPKLVLVVGSIENSDLEKISQACLGYHNVEVIDYDAFCSLFLN